MSGTYSLHFTHTRQGNLTSQFLALPVQLPKLAIVQPPEVEQVFDLGLTVRYSWLWTQALMSMHSSQSAGANMAVSQCTAVHALAGDREVCEEQMPGKS